MGTTSRRASVHNRALDLRYGVSGHFTVELLDARAYRAGIEVVKRRLKFRNLILNVGLNRVMDFSNGVVIMNSNGGGVTQACVVGTGSTAPAVGQTALASFLFGTTNNSGFPDTVGSGPAGGGPGGGIEYWSFFRTRLFTETEANGNLTEVGMCEGSPATNMWTRQLLLDEFATPTTITKTAAELLRIVYEVRVYPPIAVLSHPGQVIGPVTSTVTVHPIRVNKGSSWGNMRFIGSQAAPGAGNSSWRAFAREENTDLSADFKADPTGFTVVQSNNGSAGVQSAYVAGSFEQKILYSWDLGIANFATGIGSVFWGAPNSGSVDDTGFYIRFNPKVPKTNIDKFNLTLKVTLARHP